jgi:hypothetical protein
VKTGTTEETPLRAGVFATVQEADRAVHRLLDAGFTVEQITVLCSDVVKEKLFQDFEHQDVAGANVPAATVAGGTIGAILGGVTIILATAATGGAALLASGGLAAWTGGVVGALMGAMSTRGGEKELANFYNQAVLEGKLLVAVQDDDQDPLRHRQRLTLAEQIITAAGAQPIALCEG